MITQQQIDAQQNTYIEKNYWGILKIEKRMTRQEYISYYLIVAVTSQLGIKVMPMLWRGLFG